MWMDIHRALQSIIHGNVMVWIRISLFSDVGPFSKLQENTNTHLHKLHDSAKFFTYCVFVYAVLVTQNCMPQIDYLWQKI